MASNEVLLKHESISGITTAAVASMLCNYLARRSCPRGPYVCPGCYAVAPERCAPGCIDAEIEEDHRRAIERGDYDRFDDGEDEDEP